MASTFHDNFPQLALAVLLLISPRPLSHGRPGSWAPVQVIMMTRMVMVMIMTTTKMMMVRTNNYIWKKTPYWWDLGSVEEQRQSEQKLEDPDIFFPTCETLLCFKVKANMMTQPTNKQNICKQTVSGLARRPLPLCLSPPLPSHHRRLQVLTHHPIIKTPHCSSNQYF